MNSLQDYPELEIYTDGSLIKNEETQSTSIGFGWLISKPENILINFKGFLKGFNAKILAILSALTVYPRNSTI
jgi:hypothetical protein